jgi:hypothetical protein
MQPHTRPKIEIESLQSQQRPDADVYQPDSGNCATAHGCRLDPRSHRVLEHGSQQERGQAYDQRRGDRSEPPPSPACSIKHPRKDATAASRKNFVAIVEFRSDGSSSTQSLETNRRET